MPTTIKLLLTLLLLPTALTAQSCIGGEIHTQEAFLHGRFEVGMRSAQGNGIVSSFFLYNLDLGCNWPAENNEIDIEMTGNKQNLLFTTHYPGPWYYTDSVRPSFNPHAAIHDYAIEWEPGIVRWFVDGQLAYVQNQPFVAGLIYPLRVFMNLWAADNVGWVGVWDPAIMPVESEYEYVTIYDYTPGTGNYGTNNNFTFRWRDDLNSFDDTRWEQKEFWTFNGNYCSFEPSSVEYRNGRMYLQLEEPTQNPPSVPVTFSVDLSRENLAPTDVIFLNGSFNGWCGNCEVMTETNGIWSVTVDLEPGTYEYLYTKNVRGGNGGAPLGSSCDFNPCDQYTNYGVAVNVGSPPMVLDTVCWGECSSCLLTGIPNPLAHPSERTLIRVTDLLGREVQPQSGQLHLYQYSDGSVEKRVAL